VNRVNGTFSKEAIIRHLATGSFAAYILLLEDALACECILDFTIIKSDLDAIVQRFVKQMISQGIIIPGRSADFYLAKLQQLCSRLDSIFTRLGTYYIGDAPKWRIVQDWQSAFKQEGYQRMNRVFLDSLQQMDMYSPAVARRLDEFDYFYVP